MKKIQLPNNKKVVSKKPCKKVSQPSIKPAEKKLASKPSQKNPPTEWTDSGFCYK